MGGGLLTQAALSIAGGMFDAWVFGDMEENGFFNSLGSVVLSSAISFGIGVVAKGIASNIKASSLKKMTNHLAKGKLGAMGITAKISSKTTKNTLTKIIYKSNWIGNIIAVNVSGSIFGGATSIGYGY